MADLDAQFTGTDGADLVGYVSDSGHTLSRHPGFPSNTGGAEIRANRARPTDSNTAVLIFDWVPDTADYDGWADLDYLATVNGGVVGIVMRCDPTTDDMLVARYNTHNASGFQPKSFALYERRTGFSEATLWSLSRALNAGDSPKLEFRLRGTDVQIWIDGVHEATVTTNITAKGRVGLQLNGDLASTTTGLQVDRLFATNTLAADELPDFIGFGDSITANNYATSGVTGYVERLPGILNVITQNEGHNSYSTDDLYPLIATDLAPLRDPDKVQVVCHYAGTNDIKLKGYSAATIIAQIQTNCLAIKALGYRVIVAGIGPRENDLSFYAVASAVNDWLDAHYQEIADDYLDIRGDKRLGPAGSEDDTTYDGIHFDDPHQIIITEKVAGKYPEILTRTAGGESVSGARDGANIVLQITAAPGMTIHQGLRTTDALPTSVSDPEPNWDSVGLTDTDTLTDSAPPSEQAYYTAVGFPGA